jgi:phospholipid-binding lipoprotein MlaA
MPGLARCALLVGSGLIVGLTGCVTPPRDTEALAAFRAAHDPLEQLNRKTFAFNQVVDRIALKPIAKGYVRVIPSRGREGIRNLLLNLHEPVVFANNLLQGEFKRAGTTAARFVINSTLGLVGVLDIAARHHLVRQSGDFGQTLYVWGVPEGPYLVVPVFGPTSPRDGIGMAADIFMDPFLYLAPQFQYRTAVTLSRATLTGIDQRSRNIDSLEEIQREAIDFYASFRSLYRQNRAAELRHAGAPAEPTEDLYNDPDKPKAGAPLD